MRDHTPFGAVLAALMICLPARVPATDQPVLPQIDRHAVRWVATHTGDNAAQQHSGWRARISDLILGRKTQRLRRPISITQGPGDEIWVLDQGLHVPIRLQLDNDRAHRIKIQKGITLSSLVGVARMGQDMLLTDSRLQQVFVARGEGPVRVLNDSLRLSRPTGIAYCESTDRIWVAETDAHRLAVLDGKGRLLNRIGVRGTDPGEFNYPTFLSIDDAGRIYVVDSMNFRIQILDAEGRTLRVFGKAGDATGYFARPKGIATDSHGNIYVADALFHTVQVFDHMGRFLLNFGKQGRGEGDFWMPIGLHIDKEDKIYVADSYNARLQVFELIGLDADED